jgi:hypothetical protein
VVGSYTTPLSRSTAVDVRARSACVAARTLGEDDRPETVHARLDLVVDDDVVELGRPPRLGARGRDAGRERGGGLRPARRRERRRRPAAW